MAADSEDAVQLVDLVRQHLKENEVLDEVFAVGPVRVVAITSERIMIVRGGAAGGWALKWISWRVVTGVELKGEDPGSRSTVQVRYNRARQLARKGEAPEADEEAVDFHLPEAEDAQRMVHLTTARRDGV